MKEGKIIKIIHIKLFIKERVITWSKIQEWKNKYRGILSYSPKGEITIEASIVVPMILLVISFIIGVAFYLHDIVVTDAYSYSRIIEYDNYNSNNNEMDIEDDIKSRIENDIPVFMADISVVSLGTDGVEIINDFDFPIQWVNNILISNTERTIEREDNINIEMLHICSAVLNTY